MAGRYGRDDLLPLWVADMDYPSPGCIRDALAKAVAQGIYGYFAPPASYQDAFMAWEKEQHGVSLERAWLRFTPGVVTGIYWSISSLTQPGDAVAILTPCYYPFMDAVKDTGRRLVCSNLTHSEAGYTVDFADLEKKFAEERVKMLLLCSPHNPVGRVWTEEELLGILSLCRKYSVIVVSDEIHQDMVFGGAVHHSCLLYPEYVQNVILLTAASKTFNIAGLQNSFAVIPNDSWREAFDRYVKSVRIKKGVSLGYIAAEAGFRGGLPWLQEVREYIAGNAALLTEMLQREFPAIRVEPLQGTYMMWIDLSAYLKPEQLVEVVQNQAKLAVDFGFWFWPQDQLPAGEAHIRINTAASRENIKKAAEQLCAALRTL